MRDTPVLVSTQVAGLTKVAIDNKVAINHECLTTKDITDVKQGCHV